MRSRAKMWRGKSGPRCASWRSGSGAAVPLITSDLTEMVDVADRVAVMDEHRIQGLVENDRNYERASIAIMVLIHGRKAA
jgi:ABC-type sugar transport system ATPase subunit